MELARLGALAGLAGGLLIIGVGAFVWRARPERPLHRAFFAFALVDGLSTVALRLSYLTPDAALRAVAVGAYWWTFIPFVAALAAFSLAFPRPLGGPARRRLLVAGPLVGAGVLLLALAVRPSAFWTLQPSGESPYRYGPAGLAVSALFVAIAGLALLKLTRELRRASVDSQRRQTAVVLAGLALLCAPFALTAAGRALVPATLTGASPMTGAAYAIAGAFACAYAFSLGALASHARTMPRRDAALLLGVLALVALSLPVAYLAPSSPFLGALRGVGLLAYPLLLAYAIVRWEIFDIDARIRRALTIPLLGAILAGAFFTIELLLGNYLQERFEGAVASTWVAALAAGIAAAILSFPLARLVKVGVHALVPRPDDDAMRARALEIYRHSVAAAVADGAIQASEGRALAALRESLHISADEHERVLREVTAAT